MLFNQIFNQLNEILDKKDYIGHAIIKQLIKSLLSDILSSALYVSKHISNEDFSNKIKNLMAEIDNLKLNILFPANILELAEKDNKEREADQGFIKSEIVEETEIPLKLIQPNLLFGSQTKNMVSANDKTYQNDMEIIKYLNEINYLVKDDSRVRIISYLMDIIDEYKETADYPPISLDSKEMNKAIINELKDSLSPEILFYLRYIKHPFKNNLTEYDKIYLTYLIEVEQWNIDYLSYLASIDKKDLEVYQKENINEVDNEIKIVETYLHYIKEMIEAEKERINVVIDKDNSILEVNINPKKVLFNNEIGKTYLFDYLRLWGMLFEYKIPKNYKIKTIKTNK